LLIAGFTGCNYSCFGNVGKLPEFTRASIRGWPKKPAGRLFRHEKELSRGIDRHCAIVFKGVNLVIRNYVIATAFTAAMFVAAAPVSAQFGTGNSPNNLFSQYATQPGASSTTAGMYPAPHYVPAQMGQSYYTYQPLMPHEMMYQHSRNYYNYYNTGGYNGGNDSLNKTTVRWQSGYNHMGHMPFSGALAQSLKWKCNKKRYCLDGGCDGSSVFGRHGCIGGHCLHGSRCDGDCYSDASGGESLEGGCAGGGCASNPDTNVRR
jgi:hypothetical protein